MVKQTGKRRPNKKRFSLGTWVRANNRSTSFSLVALVFVAVFGTIGLRYFGSGHAEPINNSGAVGLCMSVYPNECFASQGPYNTMLVKSSPISYWFTEIESVMGNKIVVFQDNSKAAHCLKVGNNDYVTVGSVNGCDTSFADYSEDWLLKDYSTYTSHGYTVIKAGLFNERHLCYAVVDQYATINNQFVQCKQFSGNPTQGWDWHWTFIKN